MARQGFLLALLLLLPSLALGQPIQRNDLKPGLIFLSADGAEGLSTTISRIELLVAMNLAPGEAAHPRSSGGMVFRWIGTINIVTPGKYRFSANVAGNLTVRVGETVVLNAAQPAAEAKLIEGAEVTLPAGIQVFEATLQRTSPQARVELLWKGPGFRTEPIPYFFFGHLPKQRPTTFTDDLSREHGRFLVEELACVRCHQPTANDKTAKTLAERSGPNLTEIGKRAFPGWLDAWLADPHKLRPNTTMPKMFADTEQGKAERYAVVSYLVSLGGPVPTARPVNQGEYQKSIATGQKLYLTAGCAACHGDKLTQPPTRKKKDDPDEDDKPQLTGDDSAYSLGTAGPQGFYLLGSPGSKTRPEVLAKYLENPLATNPHGRMPNMVLNGEEARDIARFLCRQVDDTIDYAMPPEPKVKPSSLLPKDDKDPLAAADLKGADQWKEVGRRLFLAKGCVNCHTVQEKGKNLPVTTAPTLAKVQENRTAGCVAEKPDPAKVPVYSLDAKQKQAITNFLANGLGGAGSNAPSYQSRAALKRFNCLNCHNRDGEGGIALELADQMKMLEKAENADDVSPPRLTGVGHKMRSSWMRQVLTQGGRARPWMTLRMPQYGEGNVGGLTEGLAKLEGTTPDDTIGKAEFTAAKVEAGRTLAGKNGHGCVSCHDLSGVQSGGTRGPDLATTNQRVRYDWYLRWMHLPQRIAPGTKMPQVAIDGKSLLTTVFDGDADRQFEALWAYFSLGPGLPLPSGMEPPKGVVIAVKDRPEILRTFMPDGAGSKAIAIGFPGGVNTVFDAATCRLTYGWSGNFLDASPVWNNRGGAPAKLLGPKFYTASGGFPWAATESRTPPDFLKRADDPAYGVPLPEDRFYGGPRYVQFAGYFLNPAGNPTFRYALTDAEGKPQIAVQDLVEPLPVTVSAGLKQSFTVDLPAGKTPWFFAGTSTKDPRAYTEGGQVVSLNLKQTEQELPAAGHRLVLPTENNRAVVLEAVGAPTGTVWRLVPRSGAGWVVMLRFPESMTATKAEFQLLTWGLPRDDEDLLKGLKSK